MKIIKNIFLLLFLFATLFAKYHIVIVAGQSNCLNIHTRASALPSCESDSLVPFFFDLYYPPSFAPNDLVTSSDDHWEGLQAHLRETNTGPTYSFFGPEITLARTLSEYMDSVAIFKYGVAGSDLAYDWGLAVTGGPEIFDKFVAKIRIAEQAFDAAGIDFEWTAATWMQGESDADDQSQARDYYQNLGYFMKCLRDTLNLPDLPFVIGAIADELPLGSYPYRETVLDAQRRRAETDPNALLVNTADYEMDTDNVHFNSNGVMELGTEFAEAIVTLTTETAIVPNKFVIDDDMVLLPNPVNGNAKAIFMLKDPGKLNMTLYDLQGSKILEMNFGTYPAGEHQLIFPVYDLQSGMYIVKLTANDQIFTKKFSVLK
jgi:Carbohydrate esterase, sialic acid-specific acetylesterase/Secretion system C-terminal sorting domain